MVRAGAVGGPHHGEELVDELVGGQLGDPGLRDVGIARDGLERMASDAMLQTRLLVNNPRPVSEDDALAIYSAAF